MKWIINKNKIKYINKIKLISHLQRNNIFFIILLIFITFQEYLPNFQVVLNKIFGDTALGRYAVNALNIKSVSLETVFSKSLIENFSKTIYSADLGEISHKSSSYISREIQRRNVPFNHNS